MQDNIDLNNISRMYINRSFFDAIPDMMFVVDRDFRIRDSNQAAKDAIAALFPGRDTCYGSLTGGDEPCSFCHVRKTFTDGQQHTYQYFNPILKAYFLLYSYPVFKPGTQEVEFAVEAARNITEQITYEQSLEVMQNVIDHISIPICHISAEGKFLYVNQSAVRAFGCTDENDILGEAVNVFYPALHEQTFQKFWHYLKKRKTYKLRGTISRRDGRDFTASIFCDSIEINEIRVLVVCIQDLTEHLKRVAAEESAQRKAIFLASMSHEIRQPMNAIIGMLTVARRAESASHRSMCLDKIEVSSMHLLRIINTVLDLAKIEAKRFELSPVEFNLSELLQRAAVIASTQFNLKQQEFSVLIDRRIPDYLIGDDQRLSQVVLNLLSNASKFAPENGWIKMTVRQAELCASDCKICIAVSDNGIGISEEQQKKLFKVFSQAEASTTRKFGGTGLGLAISRQIVEMMNGAIHVKSELGKGAHFIFTITLARSPKVAKYFYAEQEIKVRELRMLLISPSVHLLEAGKEIMSQLAIKCDYARNHAESLDFNIADARYATRYDCVLLDWAMPESAQLADTMTGGGNRVIVLAAAENWSEIRDVAEKAGVFSFLPKPLFLTDVVTFLEQYFVGSASVSPLSTQTDDTDFSAYTILVAEDIEVNREVLSEMLKPTQLKIDFAEDGEITVQRFRAEPEKYALIFLDLQMPKLDGFEAAKTIRASRLSRAETIPLIALSADIFQEDIKKCRDAGMNDHLAKPINYDQLLTVIKKFTDHEIGGKRI